MGDSTTLIIVIFTIIMAFIGMIAVIKILWAQRKRQQLHGWLLENGTPGTARIISVRDTKVRNSQDYFVLEIELLVLDPRHEKEHRTTSVAVSPLDFHRVGAGAEVPIFIHPDEHSVTLNLPASQ